MALPATRGPGRPPGTKATETRKRIIRAAREIFCEVGYDAATFEGIATRADLTRPAINHYFRNKRALYREVVDDTHVTVMQTSVEQAIRQDTLLNQIGLFMALMMAADPERIAAKFMVTSILESHRHPDLCEPEQDLAAKTRNFIEKVVNDAVKRGELAPDTDVPALVDMMSAVLWGMGIYAGFIGSIEGLPAAAEQLRRLIVGKLWTADD